MELSPRFTNILNYINREYSGQYGFYLYAKWDLGKDHNLDDDYDTLIVYDHLHDDAIVAEGDCEETVEYTLHNIFNF